MKKKTLKKGILAGTIFFAALNFNACKFNPAENYEADVYGPPEDYTEEIRDDNGPDPASADGDVSLNDTGSITKEADFDPSANFEPCVYGPPESFQ